VRAADKRRHNPPAKKGSIRVFRGLIYAIAHGFQEMRDGQQGSVFRIVGLEAALDG
jgi:hypothetical protein